ncbi:MAG TPA: aldose 1-epimerase [Clostridiaceae bacterium]
MGTNFTSEVRKDFIKGIDIIILRSDNCEAYIAPSLGANLCRFSYKGKNIIDYKEEALLSSYFTGTPILYPTPNRVKNGKFTYLGKEYIEQKNGERILIHGLVFNETWEYDKVVITEESISIKLHLNFLPGKSYYEAFPFNSTIWVEYILYGDGLKLIYTIENNDNKALPFGFAVHPYFTKLSGDEGTLIEMPAASILECKEGYFTTGKTIPVKGTSFDLLSPVKVGSLKLDTNYTDLDVNKPSIITYEGLDFSLNISCTEDFKHIVLYTPKGTDYFCLENQTSSIDAHNVYDKGFKELSGLIVLAKGKSKSGFIDYKIIKF